MFSPQPTRPMFFLFPRSGPRRVVQRLHRLPSRAVPTLLPGFQEEAAEIYPPRPEPPSVGFERPLLSRGFPVIVLLVADPLNLVPRPCSAEPKDDPLSVRPTSGRGAAAVDWVAGDANARAERLSLTANFEKALVAYLQALPRRGGAWRQSIPPHSWT